MEQGRKYLAVVPLEAEWGSAGSAGSEASPHEHPPVHVEHVAGNVSSTLRC